MNTINHASPAPSPSGAANGPHSSATPSASDPGSAARPFSSQTSPAADPLPHAANAPAGTESAAQNDRQDNDLLHHIGAWARGLHRKDSAAHARHFYKAEGDQLVQESAQDFAAAPATAMDKPFAAPPMEPAGHARPDDRDVASTILETLRKRYLITDSGQFYFRDRQQALAFEDLGQRLRTSHDDADVAHAMVELAQAKGWADLKLRGSAAFKREAWLAAAERGLHVNGYRPNALDKARLAERRRADGPQAPLPGAGNSVEPLRSEPGPGSGKESAAAPPKDNAAHAAQALEQLKKFLRQRGDSEAAVAMTAQLAAEALARHRTHFGKLLEHGKARFHFAADSEMNYFVTLATPSGRQTIWGVDLERAIERSGAEIGDGIVLVQQGSRRVTVAAPARDAGGDQTGRSETIDARRHVWQVLSLDNTRDFGVPAQPSASPTAPTQEPTMRRER